MVLLDGVTGSVLSATPTSNYASVPWSVPVPLPSTAAGGGGGDAAGTAVHWGASLVIGGLWSSYVIQLVNARTARSVWTDYPASNDTASTCYAQDAPAALGSFTLLFACGVPRLWSLSGGELWRASTAAGSVAAAGGFSGVAIAPNGLLLCSQSASGGAGAALVAYGAGVAAR